MGTLPGECSDEGSPEEILTDTRGSDQAPVRDQMDPFGRGLKAS